jgi:hypothetical protein
MNRTDVRRVANFLYNKYGSEAARRAGENLDWAIANGDLAATRNWMRVVRLATRYQGDGCPDAERTDAAPSNIEHGEIMSTPSP